MAEKQNKIIELTGTSHQGIEDAVMNALQAARDNNTSINWYEIIETRGHIDDQDNRYHVTLKAECTD